jgi:hypothetical protein
MNVTASKPTPAQVEAVFEFLEYFANLEADGALHLLDYGGPSEIQEKFSTISDCWRRVLVAAAYPVLLPATISQPSSPSLVLGGGNV